MKMNMQPIQIDSSKLIKTHSQERSFFNLFEISIKKKIFILFAICFQIIIFYLYYSPELSSYWNANAFTERTSDVLTSNINDTLCQNGTCLGGNKIPISNNNSSSGIIDTEHSQATISTSVTSGNIDERNEETTTTKETSKSITSKVDEKDVHDIKLETGKSSSTILPNCSSKPPGLQGNLDISFAHEAYKFKQIREDNPLVSSGGYFRPPFCKALWKVAIVIPFRDRDEHLQYFLQYMHPILQRQQLEYRIYIVNQFGNGKFNRAKLMNIGYAESTKDLDFDCFVFHDVDLILENDYAIYSCPEKPRHLSVAVDKFNYKLPYAAIFGGVTEFTKKQFEAVNGYSNSFWGWGGEDDDMYNRVRISHMQISRYPASISRYRMISHGREKGNEPNPKRFDLIRQTGMNIRRDGLNSLKYKVVHRDDNALYTNITVDVLVPS